MIPDMSEYLYVFLKYAGPSIDERATGTTFKEVAGREFALIPVAIPPIMEQRRIVGKLDELMELVDGLEKHLLRSSKFHKAFASAAVNQYKVME